MRRFLPGFLVALVAGKASGENGGDVSFGGIGADGGRGWRWDRWGGGDWCFEEAGDGNDGLLEALSCGSFEGEGEAKRVGAFRCGGWRGGCRAEPGVAILENLHLLVQIIDPCDSFG